MGWWQQVATTELGYIVFYGQQKWSASSSWAVNQAETENGRQEEENEPGKRLKKEGKQ